MDKNPYPPSTPNFQTPKRIFPSQPQNQTHVKTSFNSRNKPQIIQNNNFITLNNNQTIITSFNNVLSGKSGLRRNSSFNRRVNPKRSNSVMSMNENNSASFISRENSTHSAMNVYNSKMFTKSSPRRLNQISNLSKKSFDNSLLNFKYDRKYSQQSPRRNMIPNTKKNNNMNNINTLKMSNSKQNLKFSIVKGDSDFIKNKKRQFSRSGSRIKLNVKNRSPHIKNNGWAMESQVGGATNFDYSKPYKSPDTFKYKKDTYGNKPIKVMGSKQTPISLANSKHFEGNKSESLLMKLKENQIDNIDLNNLDLGNRKNLLQAQKMYRNNNSYGKNQNNFKKKKISKF